MAAIDGRTAPELYNGACAIAHHLPPHRISGAGMAMAEQSILNLREAAAAGWTNWGHTAADSDLRCSIPAPIFRKWSLTASFPATPLHANRDNKKSRALAANSAALNRLIRFGDEPRLHRGTEWHSVPQRHAPAVGVGSVPKTPQLRLAPRAVVRAS